MSTSIRRMAVLSLAVMIFMGSAYADEPSPEQERGVTGELWSVQVYRDDRVGRPYEKVGEVEATGGRTTPEFALITVLKQQAAALGADAIINLRTSIQRSGGSAGRTFCPKGQHDCYTVNPHSDYLPSASGTAIKFTDREKK